MIFEDYLDFIEILNQRNVRFVLVGGLAVVIHGFFRTTKDMDLYYEPTDDNCEKIAMAIKDFGLGYLGIAKEDLMDTEGFIKLGNSPVRIDMFCALPGVEFEEVYRLAMDYNEERVPFKVIHINHLIENKKAVGRTQDLTDVRNLQKILKRKK